MDEANTAGKKREVPTKKQRKGMALKTMTTIMASVTVVISVLLIVCVYFNFKAYNDLEEVSEEYIKWQKSALDLQQASDFLTDRARSFVETGEKEYVRDYFREAKKSKRRDKAIEFMEKLFPDSHISERLNAAMAQSLELMNTEYYAMRLIIEAYSYDIAEFEPELQKTILTEEDNLLDDEGKIHKAQIILFDKKYHDAKIAISNNTAQCLQELSDELKTRQDLYSERLNLTLLFSLVLILLSIIFAVAMVLLTHLQVFKPLIKSVPLIEKDDLIPVEGAYEFRVLAKTYNVMHEANARSKSNLKYKANHDALTGVLNRRGFASLAEHIVASEIALLIADIDNFKQVNDKFGHVVGDRILVGVVEILKNNFRADDKICRLGGDEFAIVMTSASEDEKEVIEEKIKKINDHLLKISSGLPPVTLSVGAAFGKTLDEALYKKADEALYRTKNSGKCGCTFAE